MFKTFQDLQRLNKKYGISLRNNVNRSSNRLSEKAKAMKSTSDELILEIPKSHSKPSAGKTMFSLVKKHGSDLHNAHIALMGELQPLLTNNLNENWIQEHLLFKSFSRNKILLEKVKVSLFSASLLLNWICGRILNSLSNNNNLHDAELWFHNSSSYETLSQYIKPDIQENILSHLRKLNLSLMSDELPYLSEVFETENEIANEKGVGRVKKKSNGIYYTPSDVVDFIVNRSFANSKIDDSLFSNTTWYDPALGTGIFLLSVLKQYSSKKHLGFKSLINFCQENLFGTDISPLALQSSAYILSTHCLLLSENGNLKEIAVSLKNNLALIDATSINSKEKLSKVFPLLGEQGADFIISNPPYSKKKQLQFDLFYQDGFPNNSFGVDLYPYFVKQLLDLSKSSNGGGGMVVPLSLAASSKKTLRALRNYIQKQNGSIEFLNFDRTPDSLFGDDVKTRNTIFFFTHQYDSEKIGKISSTYLHRWNSRNRADLFNSISVTNLQTKIDITYGVPKVGDEFGVSILNIIHSKKTGKLSEVLQPTKSNPKIITRTTAYNWIPVELYIGEANTTGKVFWKIISTDISPETIYALLNSRITYWLWRLWSDGFHLTNQFISSLPYGTHFFNNINTRHIEELGKTLWDNTQKEVIISKNAGKLSYSYCPLPFSDLLDEIDEEIINYFSLPKLTVPYLIGHIHQIIVAGRENESQIKTKLKYLEKTN